MSVKYTAMRILDRGVIIQKITALIMIGVTLYFYCRGVERLVTHSNYWPNNEGQIGLVGIMQWTGFTAIFSLIVFWFLSALVKTISRQNRLGNILWLNLFFATNFCIMVLFWLLPVVI